MEKKQVLIVGGGASGMMAACGAAEAGHDVVLIEKNGRLGRKLALTGNGRCNVTNASDPETFLDHVVSNRNFLYSAFYGFSSEDMIRFLLEEGLGTKEEADCRIFPVTDRAEDVIRVLERRMKRAGVRVLLNSRVKKLLIEAADGADAPSGSVCRGVELSDGKRITADVTILAAGGLSYPATGSDGEGMRMAEACGHQVRPPRPGLAPFVIRESFGKQLQGRAFQNIRMTVSDSGGNRLFDDTGDVLFTHFGISGPMVLAASSYCTGYFGRKPAADSPSPELTVKLDFFPEENHGRLEQQLTDRAQSNGKKQLNTILESMMPKALAPVMLEQAGADPALRAGELSRQTRQELVRCMKGLSMHVTGVRGFREAMVTQGGIRVSEVDPATMASLRVGGLRFAGEILDLDALTGGYNLQIAWSTGWAAGFTIEQED